MNDYYLDYRIIDKIILLEALYINGDENTLKRKRLTKDLKKDLFKKHKRLLRGITNYNCTGRLTIIDNKVNRITILCDE